MDGSTSKAQVMKPALLKAAIPLAISVAGFFYARIMARRTTCPGDSTSAICQEDSTNSMAISEYQEGIDYQQEISDLRGRVEELQKKEWETEMEFARYRDLKEKESVLGELKNMLSMEIAYVEFLDREISSMETQNKRVNSLVVEYLKILEQLQHWKSEGKLLRRQVKKLSKKTKAQSCTIAAKNSKIEAREAELQRNYHVIKKLEDEVRDLQDKLKVEGEGITVEDYKLLVNEHEQLQKDRAAEVKELIYLRWTNACLRHALMTNQAERERNQEEQSVVDLAFEGIGEIGMENDEASLKVGNASNHAHDSSKKQKLLKKFRRWVDGSEKMNCKFDEKEKQEIKKCFGRHSASEEAEEEHVIHGSKSCSSA